MDLIKYRVWCNTEESWVETDYRQSEPTTCPNNNTHTIDIDKTTILSRQLESPSTNTSGILRVQNTPRPTGMKTYFTGHGDNVSDPNDVGGGGAITFSHTIGQSLSQTMYVDFNCINNKSFIHGGLMMFTNALFDKLSFSMVTLATSFETAGIKSITFNGSGLNDMSNSGTFTGSSSKDYKVEIYNENSPDSFRWSNDDGQSWEAVNVPITGSPQELEEGVYITFASTTGHSLGDDWSFRAVTSDTLYKLYNNYLIVPSSFPYGDIIDVTSDLTLHNGGLVYAPLSDEGIRPPAYWNATWNTSTNQFENISADPDGNGEYNLFSSELELVRFINKYPLLGSDSIQMTSYDVDEIGQGIRLKCLFETVGNDHNWSVSAGLGLFRERTK